MAPEHFSLLSAFPNVRYCSECRLFTWHPQGVLDDTLLDQIATFIEVQEHVAPSPSFHRYTDLSGLTDIRLKIGHVFDVVHMRRASVAEMSVVRSAIFSDKVVGFGIARMYEALMEGACVQVRAFRERQAAAEWLGVRPDLLAEK